MHLPISSPQVVITIAFLARWRANRTKMGARQYTGADGPTLKGVFARPAGLP